MPEIKKTTMSTWLFVFLLLTALKTTAAMPESCDEPETLELPVYYGWPVTLSCGSAMGNLLSSLYYGGDGLLSCTIIDMVNGRVLINTSSEFTYDDYYGGSGPEGLGELAYTIDEVTEYTSTSFEIVVSLQGDSPGCFAQIVNLNVSDFVEQTCEESVEADDVTLDKIDKEVGRTTSLRCDVPGHFDGPNKLIDDEKANAHWLFNCGTDLPGNAVKDHDTQHALLLTNISYQANPGIYTCVLEHRGMTRHRIHYKVCVKDQVSKELSIKCPNYKAAIGQDIEIECDVDAGLGIENTFVFTSWFNKLDDSREIDQAEENVSCSAYADRNETTSPNDRITCGMITSTVGKVECFYKPPSPEQYQAQKTMVKTYYKIRNVQSSDFGEYKATFKRLDKGNSTIFKLEMDLLPGLEKSTIIIIICMSVLLGCGLFIFMVFVLCGIEIRWIWKRNFGSRESGIKKYAGYLAYYYNKDMPETSPTDLDAFVKNLDTRIKRLGGALYDKCRDHTDKQYIAENIHAMLTQCHRVIIILTPEYIRDQWSVYEAYEAWKNVIEHGIPVIFITFPTTASAIQDLPTESRIALNKALKRHSVIEWNGNFPFSRRMRMRLEILMPKLPRGGDVELTPKDNRCDDTVRVKMQNGNTENGSLDNNKNVYENAV